MHGRHLGDMIYLHAAVAPSHSLWFIWNICTSSFNHSTGLLPRQVNSLLHGHTQITLTSAVMGSLHLSIYLLCKCLDCGRKSQYLERAHADSGASFKAKTLLLWGTELTTAPPPATTHFLIFAESQVYKSSSSQEVFFRPGRFFRVTAASFDDVPHCWKLWSTCPDH